MRNCSSPQRDPVCYEIWVIGRFHHEGSSLQILQLPNVKPTVLYYRRKWERTTHKKCISGLGSNHNLVPASCFIVEHIVSLARGQTEIITLQCLLSLSALCWLTQEADSPQLVISLSMPWFPHYILFSYPVV